MTFYQRGNGALNIEQQERVLRMLADGGSQGNVAKGSMIERRNDATR